MGYRIAAALVLLLFGATWYATVVGYGLPSTAQVDAYRQQVAQRRSVRLGYVGTGPHYGK